MSLDPRIEQAVRDTACRLGQPEQLADRLVSYLEQLSSGNEQMTERESVYRHLETILSTMDVDTNDTE